MDDQMTLGYKGLGLKHLAAYGLNVPECFVITTELFSALPAMSYGPMYRDTIGRIRQAIEDMEERTGLRLGIRTALSSSPSARALRSPCPAS